MKSKGVIERTMDEPTGIFIYLFTFYFYILWYRYIGIIYCIQFFFIAEKPAYWNNTPKESDSNSFLELSKLKSDVKKHKEQQKAEANRLAEEEAKSKESEELWYKDESEEFQENLKEYQHRMSDHNR